MNKVWWLGVVAVAAVGVGLMLGPRLYPPDELLRILRTGQEGVEYTILARVRLPRVSAGFLVGAGLSVSGVILQAVLRNPLAESYTLGISGGASLGICLGMLAGRTASIPVYAFAGALASISVVLAAAGRRRLSPGTLILLGVVVNFVCSSLVLLLLAVTRREQFHQTFFWLIGDLSATPEGTLGAALVIVPALCLVLVAFSRVLDVLSVGEEKAATLGLQVRRSVRILLFLAACLAGVCVSLAGMVGFVGLIVPHICRLLIGGLHRRIVPASFLLGGCFLVLCDGASRTILRPLEIPVGVITGLCGGVFFLALLLTGKRSTGW